VRRIVPALVVAAVAAAWVAAARGTAPTSACPTSAASTFAKSDMHSFEFEGHGFTLDSFGDARGHVMTILGDDSWSGMPPPGLNENTVVNGGQVGTDVLFDPGHPNSYVARGHTTEPFVEITVKRYSPSIDVDGIAVWWLWLQPTSNFAVAFANGQQLSSLRLCLGNAALPPTGVVQGAAASNLIPPRVTANLAGGRVVLTATPSKSGLAGIWWSVEGTTLGGRYTQPLALPRTATIDVCAVDRAGNYSLATFAVAKL
jgi:hypothetical protein